MSTQQMCVHTGMRDHLKRSTHGAIPSSGPPIPPEDPGKAAGEFHPLGSRINPSRPHTQVAVRADEPPRQWAYARQPHQRCFSSSHFYAPFMLMNSCSLPMARQLFKRMIDQFDRLRRRNAFVEQYKKEKIFQDGLEEFDDAWYVRSSPFPRTLVLSHQS